MEWLLEEILANLIYIAYGIAIFVCAYLGNAAFSIYYNVEILEESFDWHKVLTSVLKILCVAVGTTLISIAITTLPEFADFIGWELPDEYKEVISSLAIILVYGSAAVKYIIEAVGKLRSIIMKERVEITKLPR